MLHEEFDAVSAHQLVNGDSRMGMRLTRWRAVMLMTLINAALALGIVNLLYVLIWPAEYADKILPVSLVTVGVTVAISIPTNLFVYELLLRAVRDRVAMERLAATDYLTGVANRRGFERAVRRLLASGTGGAFLIVDLDHFKRVNDSHGHDAGDRMLARVGVELRAALRAGDVVGRIGGEEFGVFMPGLEREQAHLVSERLRERIAGVRVRVKPGDDQISVTLSGGLACAPGGYGDLYRLADAALYRAKHAGRNRVELAS